MTQPTSARCSPSRRAFFDALRFSILGVYWTRPGMRARQDALESLHASLEGVRAVADATPWTPSEREVVLELGMKALTRGVCELDDALASDLWAWAGGRSSEGHDPS